MYVYSIFKDYNLLVLIFIDQTNVKDNHEKICHVEIDQFSDDLVNHKIDRIDF